MYKNNITSPKKFGHSKFASKTKSFNGAKRKFNNNSRPKRSGGGGSHRLGGASKKRFSGERIDFSRFIKKGQLVQEKPYVSKHTFADFPFEAQLHKNITKNGFKVLWDYYYKKVKK